MLLTSPAFTDGAAIPERFTCDGQDISPPLQISDVPEEAQSLVLIMEDPDVPASVRSDRMWDHWIVFNMQPQDADIPEGEEPVGDHGRGTSGNTDYHGPCPPDGMHRYVFKLFAIDTPLDLPEGASKQEVEKAMENHVLEKAELVGIYERP